MYAALIALINTYIVTNGNNEITAAVLNPVLKAIVDFSNDTIGNLTDLTTSDTSSIVDSINSLKVDFDNLVNNGVQLFQGIPDPNVTPPLSYGYADFYMQVDISNNPVQLWQYTGEEWTTYSDVYSKAEIDAIVAAIYSAIDAITPSGALEFIDYPLVTVAGTQNYNIPDGKYAKQVYINGAIQFKKTANNTDRTDTFEQIGTSVILTQYVEVSNYISIFYQ